MLSVNADLKKSFNQQLAIDNQQLHDSAVTLPPAPDRRKHVKGSLEREKIERGYYFRCLPTSLVISNMLTCALPAKTGFSAASALIIRLFLASCSPFFLM